MKTAFRVLPLWAAIVTALGVPRPAAANSPCISDVSSCFYRAAGIDNWLDRFLAGIDCEVAFANCVANELCK
jgi:hypothetical protein